MHSQQPNSETSSCDSATTGGLSTSFVTTTMANNDDDITDSLEGARLGYRCAVVAEFDEPPRGMACLHQHGDAALSKAWDERLGVAPPTCIARSASAFGIRTLLVGNQTECGDDGKLVQHPGAFSRPLVVGLSSAAWLVYRRITKGLRNYDMWGSWTDRGSSAAT